jgi:hypothetical protein
MILNVAAQQFLGQAHALGMGHRLGTARGSTLKRLRPVGSTSLRPLAGEPEGPGGTRRPSSAVSRPSVSPGVAINVEAVAELAFLDVADEAVDAHHGLSRAGILRQAEVLGDAAGLRFIADLVISRSRRAGSSPSAVEYSSSRRSSAAGLRAPRWPPSSVGYGPASARRCGVGLGGLARIVHDERIDHRQRADQRFGPAALRQGDGLAGQPFQRAMRANMDQRMDTLSAQPQVECDITMARDARDIVIVVIPPGRIAAFGLQGDEGLAARDGSEVEGALGKGGVVFGLAPCLLQIRAQAVGQGGQRLLIGQSGQAMVWPCSAAASGSAVV